MDTVSTTIDERGVATVTLNRPDKHNAFDDVVIAELRAAFDALAANDTVRVVVLASEGKSFSAGADLGWMKRMAAYDYSDNLADARLLADMLKALYDMPQPTIARVQGAAFGGAVGLVSCCDMAVASERASFSLSEAKVGLIPATISPYVIKAMGERAAQRYFTTAERFQAAQALRLGLISELASDDELDNVLNSLISALLQNGPLAVREAKKLVHDVAGHPITPALVEGTCEAIARIRISEEGQEGLGAFLNKRQPRWIAGE
ncbi:enoyl-CoA hydratase/isomerase family protein [Halioglobus sp. HI00S01]|uniref:enoyl-CoA hydratase/isomerase family protein n=1 Tax=Halioglobus sp. HI00S01 TaxID=1822214 RepID=UPI0018D3F6E7|nr:enoyl-CoA hydratase/isomerase family protein [Halioglobus sp. HI00S01]